MAKEIISQIIWANSDPDLTIDEVGSNYNRFLIAAKVATVLGGDFVGGLIMIGAHYIQGRVNSAPKYHPTSLISPS